MSCADQANSDVCICERWRGRFDGLGTLDKTNFNHLLEHMNITQASNVRSWEKHGFPMRTNTDHISKTEQRIDVRHLGEQYFEDQDLTDHLDTLVLMTKNRRRS